MLLMTLSTLALTNSRSSDRDWARSGEVCQLMIFHDRQAYLSRFKPIENGEAHLQSNYSNSKINLESQPSCTRGRCSSQATVPK
jgi:hypothetical protein